MIRKEKVCDTKTELIITANEPPTLKRPVFSLLSSAKGRNFGYARGQSVLSQEKHERLGTLIEYIVNRVPLLTNSAKKSRANQSKNSERSSGTRRKTNFGARRGDWRCISSGSKQPPSPRDSVGEQLKSTGPEILLRGMEDLQIRLPPVAEDPGEKNCR